MRSGEGIATPSSLLTNLVSPDTMVVDGEIVTLHKIRSVITGGKLQITRCRDNACEVIRVKLTR